MYKKIVPIFYKNKLFYKGLKNLKLSNNMKIENKLFIKYTKCNKTGYGAAGPTLDFIYLLYLISTAINMC